MRRSIYDHFDDATAVFIDQLMESMGGATLSVRSQRVVSVRKGNRPRRIDAGPFTFTNYELTQVETAVTWSAGLWVGSRLSWPSDEMFSGPDWSGIAHKLPAVSISLKALATRPPPRHRILPSRVPQGLLKTTERLARSRR